MRRAASPSRTSPPGCAARRSPPGSGSGSASASASASSPGWSATTPRRPTRRSRSRPARRGATGSPRGCTSSPAPPPCRCCWSSSGRSTRSCSSGRRGRAAPRWLLDRRSSAARSRCWSRRRSSSSRPGWPTPRSGTRGRFSLPGHPLRRRLGRDRRAAACTSRSSCRSSATRSRADVDDDAARPPRPRSSAGALSRRGLLRTTLARRRGRGARHRRQHACRWLRQVSVLGGPLRRRARRACRSTSRPRAAGVTDVGASAAAYRLDGRARRPRGRLLAATTCEAMPQATETLPIACVEGWSASGTWTGVRVRDLLDLVEAPGGRDVRVDVAAGARRLPAPRPCPGNFADDERTLLALRPRRRAARRSTTATRAG